MTLAEQLHQKGLLEGRQEGRQQGRQEGRQEGRREGRQEALQEAVLNVLTMRFDRVPDGLRDVILSSSEAKLQLLHTAAINCQSLEAFADRL